MEGKLGTIWNHQHESPEGALIVIFIDARSSIIEEHRVRHDDELPIHQRVNEMLCF